MRHCPRGVVEALAGFQSASAPNHRRILQHWMQRRMEERLLTHTETKDFGGIENENDRKRSTMALAVDNDGVHVAAAHGDHSVRIYSAQTRALLCLILGHPRTCWAIRFHPTKSRILATSCLGGLVNIWELVPVRPGVMHQLPLSARLLHSVSFPNAPVWSISFVEDAHSAGSALYICAPNAGMFRWSYETDNQLVCFLNSIRGAIPFGDGEILAVCLFVQRERTAGTALRMFCTVCAESGMHQSAGASLPHQKTLLEIPVINVHSDNSLAVSPCRRALAVCVCDGPTGLTTSILLTIIDDDALRAVSSGAFCHMPHPKVGGDMHTLQCLSGTARLPVDDGRPLQQLATRVELKLPQHCSGLVTCMRFSPSGRHLLVGLGADREGALVYKIKDTLDRFVNDENPTHISVDAKCINACNFLADSMSGFVVGTDTGRVIHFFMGA